MKFKIITHIPDITDEQLEKKHDFEGLIERRNQFFNIRNKTKSIGLLLAISLLFLVAVSTYFDYYTHEETKGKNQFIAPIGPLKLDTIIADSIKEEVTIKHVKTTAKTEYKALKDNDKVPQANPEQKDITLKTGIQGEYIQAMPEVGMDSLLKYLAKNIQYPVEAMNDSLMISGTITVIFTIATSGEPTDIQIKNSLGGLFDREAKRLIVNMPPWKPATINGVPVAARVSIPLSFIREK